MRGGAKKRRPEAAPERLLEMNDEGYSSHCSRHTRRIGPNGSPQAALESVGMQQTVVLNQEKQCALLII